MKWLTNLADPQNKNVTLSVSERQEYVDYLKGKITGDPKETEIYSVEELKEMGMIGVYETDG
jgi:hypothetical protein